MKCQNCGSDSLPKATLILDTGPKWRVVYCPVCERVKRIGDSVPNVKANYNGSFILMHNYKKKGGD